MVKDEIVDAVLETAPEKRQSEVPVGFVPEPTAEYRAHRKLLKAAVSVGAPPVPSPIPIPVPIPAGPRVLMWKQDPSVAEIGIRKVFLPGPVSAGPSDARPHHVFASRAQADPRGVHALSRPALRIDYRGGTHVDRRGLVARSVRRG